MSIPHAVAKQGVLTSGLLVAALALAPPVRGQPSVTVLLSADADYAVVGMADLAGDGTSAKTALICWRDSSNVQRSARLRSDATLGGLHSTATVAALEGADHIFSVRTAGYTPPSTARCTAPASGPAVQSGSTWDPLVANGHTLYLYGDAGNDILEGPPGNPYAVLFGLTGNDWLYNYSGRGALVGSGGNDELISTATGSDEYLDGGSGDDCLWASDNSLDHYDCGTHVVGDRYYSSNWWVGLGTCEISVSYCGLGFAEDPPTE